MLSSTFIPIILLIFGAILISAQGPQQDEQPIYMERREASAFGDILSELKGKGLGGRMRFGKRAPASLGEYRSIYAPQQFYPF